MKLQGSKLIVRNTGILYAKTFITMGISLVSTRLILSTLGATDFGIFSLVGGIIAMLTFLNSSMAQVTQRFLNYNLGKGNQRRLSQIFNASVVLHLAIGFLVVIIIELFGLWAFDFMLKIPMDRLFAAKMVFHFIVISTFFSIISVPYDAIINAHEHMLFDSVVGIFQSLGILSIALSLPYALASDKLIQYGFLMALLTLILLIVRRVYCRINYAESKINFKMYYKKSTVHEMIRYAKFTFLTAISSMVGFYGIPIIINSFFGAKLNASYGIAGQINGQISVFSATMMKALNPQITKSEGSANRERMLKLTMIGSKMGFILLGIFAIPFILEAPFVLKIWLKNPPEYAVNFCRMALIVSMISQLSMPFASAINAVGNIKAISIFSSVVFIAVLPAIYIVYCLNTNPSSFYAVLILSELILLLMRINFAKKIAQLKTGDILSNVFKPVLKILFFVLLFTVPIPFLFEEGFVRLGATCLVSTTMFCTITFFYGLSMEEKNNVTQLLAKAKGMLSKG